jgi:hypothetical protein
MLYFFVAPIIAGRYRDAQDLYLRRLDKRHHRHLVRTARACAIRVDQHQSSLRKPGSRHRHQGDKISDESHLVKHYIWSGLALVLIRWREAPV